MSLANRLYTGESGIDFVGKRRMWLLISAALLAISIFSLFIPGLTFGIDFRGGSLFEAEANRPVTESQIRELVGPAAEVVQLSNDTPPRVRVQTEALPQDEVARVRAAIQKATGAERVDTKAIGSKWGGTVSRRALVALAVFLVAAIAYVSLRFEFKMAVAAMVALLHDLVITAGIYALARFEVTPATVIALLTIMGYSIYDTMVVFDKVRENTSSLSSLSRTSYSDLANRAVNQTAVRSINTTVISILPVAGLLFVGAFLLGADTLKDLALALLIGLAVGAYSSIFVATPLLAAWKEREPRMQQIRARIERGGGRAAPEPATAGARQRSGAGTNRQRQAARGSGARQRAAEAEEMPMPSLPPDPVEDPALADAGDDGTEPAATGGTGAKQRSGGGQRRSGSAQQRRRSGGRQPSRSAKRRRR
jgi:preprotein translocase subunit SecF